MTKSEQSTGLGVVGVAGERLLPCPFCGSDRITVWNIRDGQQAVCKECKSTGAPTFHGLEGPASTWGHAVEAWNRRDVSPVTIPIAGLVRPIIGIENRTADEVFEIMVDRISRALASAVSAPSMTPTTHPTTGDVGVWQPMSTAPTDGKHCILAIKTGAFVYAIQGAFMNGQWMNAADIEAAPLCWMPNIRIPAEFLPWEQAALTTPEEPRS